MTATYPKIEMVLDVTTLTFEGEEVVSAKVIEEVHPISIQVPIGKLEFQVVSYDDNFSMFSGGYVDLLADRPPITAYEVVDGEDVLLGKYFLDDWENISEYEYKFEAMDIMGVLDKTPYEGAFYSALTSVETILEAVLGGLDLTYDLDSYIGAKTLKGWIPPGSYRSAIQQICFACGAVAVVARESDIQIVRGNVSDFYAIFDDVDNKYMTLPVYSPVGNSCTVEILVKLTAVEAGYVRIAEFTGATAQFGFYYNPITEYIYSLIKDDAGTNKNLVSSTVGIGTLAHFALVIDRENDLGHLLVDGEYTGSGKTLAAMGNITTTTGAEIARQVGGGLSSECEVSYFRVWDDVRTQAEIQENMYRRTPLDETDLARNYTWKEEDETDFASGEDGTFVGTIEFGRTPGQYVLPAQDFDVEDTEKTSVNPVKLKPLVTSIELVSHLYTQSTELLDIYEEDLDEGLHKIVFDQPLYGIVVAGPGYLEASLTTEDDAFQIVTEDDAFEIEIGGAYVFGSNSVNLQVSAPGGVVTITGYPYIDSQRGWTFTESGIGSSTDLNAIKVPSATLVSPDNVEEILDLLRDYFQIRYEQEMTLFPTTIKPNDTIQTTTLKNNELNGVVEKMVLDLTRGHLAKTRMVGREV